MASTMAAHLPLTDDIKVTSSTEELSEKSTSWKPQKSDIITLLILSAISLMAALDATVLITILPVISRILDGSTYEAFWTGTSYLLSSAVAQPVFTMLGDACGSAILIISALTFFASGSVVCALAESFSVLITGRFVQGIGGGGVVALVQIICAEMVPLPQRPRWFSFILAAWAIGTITGPFLGSGVTQVASFRWVFWINVPLCILSSLALPFGLPSGFNFSFGNLSQLDWMGCCIFILSLSTFLVGISWAGIKFAWHSYQTLVPILAGIYGLLFLLFWESYKAKNPFIRRSLFQKKSLCLVYIGAFTQGLILFCILYYVPLYFEAVHLQSPLKSALSLLPVSCSIIPTSIFTSHVISQKGSFSQPLKTGWILTVVGAGHLPLLNKDTSITQSAIVFIVFGMGIGMTLCSMNFVIQEMVNQEDAGKAASMYTFIRSVGMSVGVAFGGTVFQNVLVSNLRSGGFEARIAWDAERFIHNLQTMDDGNPNRAGIINAYVAGFYAVFVFIAATSAAGFLTGAFMKTQHIIADTRQKDFQVAG